MIRTRSICAAFFAMTLVSAHGDDVMDRLGEKLTFSAWDDQFRAHLSGLMDGEFYTFTGNPPGMIFTDDRTLWNSRFTLFLDAQIGPSIYVFAQGRMDQGFDPSDNGIETRLDEYALRWTPWEDGRLSLQAGAFATVVGNYVERHDSWDNPFITAPVIYENLTGIYDEEAPPNPYDFLERNVDEKYEYIPVIWGPSYATGISLSGKLGQVDYAAELKNASLSSRPESWQASERGFQHPTVSARLAWHPDMAWTLGFSASEGAYLTEYARSGLPSGTGLGDYKQKVLGQDISYAWSHWQIWAEVYQARFEVPNVGNADTVGYYLEAKYKFTPNLFAALRWNQQVFADVPNGAGGEAPWGNDLDRIDAAVTYRFTPHSQLKLQYSLQHEDRVDNSTSSLFAAQFTVRF